MTVDVANMLLDHPSGGATLALAALIKRPPWTKAPITAGVHGVSLTVPAGSVTVLLGPPGTGKTACLRIAAGLDKPDAGRVEIDGQDVTALPADERGVAMVFQSSALFPRLSVAENIEFGLRALRLPPAECARRLIEAATAMELQSVMDYKPGQLSSADQQRVALARAFVTEAPICLLDEPVANQRPERRADLRREILRLQRRVGMTMLYASSDPAEAMEMADQIVLLHAGRVEQTAVPAELYARPATRFAASYIGTPPMNLLPAGSIGPVPPGAKTVGIRPEAIRLQRAGSPARVERAEFLGSETILTLSLLRHGVRLMARMPGAAAQSVGAMVSIGCDPGQMHFFNLLGERLRTETVKV